MTERRAAARRRRKEAGLFRQASRRSGAIGVDGAIEDYDRARHLPRLIPVGPDDIAADSPAGRRALLARLARALRGARSRGRAGHWPYGRRRLGIGGMVPGTYDRRVRCWPWPIFLARAERAAA